MKAPIVLFVYNRPLQTRRLLESLANNYLSKESKLYIFSDGFAKGSPHEQIKKIAETRKVLKEKSWCGKVTIIERNKNMGLSASVIDGVTKIVNRFGRVIVLEDDLILSKNFLVYMNKALDRYEQENRVMQISGYMFPVKLNIKSDTLFLPSVSSWGWATWKRSWNLFDKDMKRIYLLAEDSDLRKKFDLNNSYPYFKMLLNQKKGRIDSWAIRFYLSVFLNHGLVLYPKKTMVWNDGFYGGGTHGITGIMGDKVNDKFMVNNFSDVAESRKSEKIVFDFLKSQNSFIKRIPGLLNHLARKYIYDKKTS